MIFVEVGTQADLLDNDDEKVEELVKNLNSRLLQPEMVTLAGVFGRFRVSPESEDCDCQGDHPDGASKQGES